MRKPRIMIIAAAVCAVAGFVIFLTNERSAQVLPVFSDQKDALTQTNVPSASPALAAQQTRTVPLPLRRRQTAHAQGSNEQSSLEARTAHERFFRWTEQLLIDSGRANEKDFVEDGRRLAQARRDALAALIEVDPKRALEMAVSWQWRQQLPPEIAVLLEQRVSGRGTYSVFGAVPLDGASEFVGSIFRYVTLDSESYRAFVYGRRLHQISQPELVFHGIAVNGALAVHEDPVRVLEAEEAAAVLGNSPDDKDPVCSVSGLPAMSLGQTTTVAYGERIFELCRQAHVSELNRRLILAEGGHYLASGGAATNAPPISPAWTHGPKKLLFLRVNFPDDPTEPITAAAATALMNQVNEFFVESSFNKTVLISTISPLLTLPQPKLFYALNGPGALMRDARLRAFEAGYNPDSYDLDIVRHETVPGFNFGGLAAVGGRGVWLQSSGLGVACHELGHNYGLFHANFWDTVRPDFPNPLNNPLDANSVVGFDSVIGTGRDIEYGDIFDTMGSGGGINGHFSALHKFILAWIPDSYVERITHSSTNRIYAHDAAPLVTGRRYLLAAPKDPERDYWISFRSRYTDAWHQSGVELHWNSWSLTLGSSQLLDSTPGTPRGRGDAALVVGRTFSDAAAEVHITPTARGGTGSNSWMDVVVHAGPFPSNTPPALQLSASQTRVSPGATVGFTASVSDANGDAVAYYWDFGDGTFGANSSTATKSWIVEGEYVVRCEASDMKGGLASTHVVITVGSPGTLRISGRVIDNSGRPLQGVRVHNGMLTNNTYADNFQWTFTDSDGRYSLVNLAPDTYAPGAFLFGYSVGPLNFSNPITLTGADAEAADFLAMPLPDFSVTGVNDAREAGLAPGQFRIARSKAIEQPVRVLFQLSGTAGTGIDYEDWPNTISLTNIFQILNSTITNVVDYYYVDLPGGLASTNIAITPITDGESEGNETVTLALGLPIQSERITATATNWVSIPGWELRDVDGQSVWFQTYPDYALAARAEATVGIVDTDPPAKPVVSVFALDDTTTENEHDSGLFVVARFGDSSNPLTVGLTVSGTATPGGDYAALPETVVLPAGELFVSLPVAAVNDSYLEGNETVVATVATNAAYDVGTPEATVTIADNDLPTVTLNTPDLEVSENAVSSARIVATRSGDLTRDLMVSYLVTGTATSGRDYAPLPGALNIPAGSASATIQVTPRNDILVEGIETLVVFISDSATYNVGWPNSATVTFLDDELPSVSIAATDDTAAEAADTGEFRITRTGNLSNELIVRFRTGGQAVHQADYAPVGNRARIPPGAASATVTITPIDDPFREDSESVFIELLPDPSYLLGATRMARVELNDDDSASAPAVGFSLLSSAAAESEGEVLLAVAVSANPADNAPIQVKYRVSGGTAVPGQDYETITNGVLTFNYADPDSDDAWTNRVQTITVRPIDDGELESDETVVLTLFDPIVVASIMTNEVVEDVNGMPVTNFVVVVTGNPGFLDTFEHHTLTILDDDLAIVSVEATVPTASENGPTPGEFTFARTGATNNAQTVYFEVAGSASSGSDFAPLGGSIVIPAGLASAALALNPVDDPAQEFAETVIVNLRAAPGAQIASANSAAVAIHDNDGTIEFARVTFEAIESVEAAPVQVLYSGNTNLWVTVDYTALGGTASAGADFVVTNGTLTFAPGETSKTLFVSIIDDLQVESAETVQLLLKNASGGAPLGGQNTATLKIVDNDTALEFSETAFTVNENGTNALIIVQRLGVVTNTVSVDYATADLIALAAEDYAATNGTVQFRPGEVSKVIRVPVRDDVALEGDETLTIALTNATGGAVVGFRSAAAVVIRDDECVLEFSPVFYSGIEYAGFITVNVRRTGGTINPVRVDFRTRDGSATNGLPFDYLAQNGVLEFRGDEWVPATGGAGQLVFRPGETDRTIGLRINDDTDGERNENFFVALQNPRPALPSALPDSVALGVATNAEITIIDNETPGHVDYEFNPGLGADGPVRSVAVQNDGKVLIGGEFTSVDGVVLPGIARLHVDGYLDSSFNPGAGPNGAVCVVKALEDGKVLAGGTFTQVNTATANRLVRLNTDGSVDGTFATGSGPNGPIWTIAEMEDGRVVIGGEFTSISGQARKNVARLLPDGSVDPEFNPGAGPNAVVYSAAAQTDSRILIAGAFTSVGGFNQSYIARLNTNGTVDAEFSLPLAPNAVVRDMALQNDGRIVLVGDFSQVGGRAAGRIARLNADGSMDAAFDSGAGANGTIFTVTAHDDRRIVLGGDFSAINGHSLNRIGRLNFDGSVDIGFNPGSGANNSVLSAVVQPDSAVVIGGRFTHVNGLPRNRVARLHGEERFALGIVQFTAVTYQIGENGGSVTLMLGRSGNLKGACSVDFSTGSGTATAGQDYQSQSGTLNFGPGEIEKSLTVNILDDTTGEGNESFLLILTNAVGVEVTEPSTAAVLIVDNESAVAFGAPTYQVLEDGGAAVVTVIRSGSTVNAASVDYYASDGSAAAGADYDGQSGTLNFAVGETNKSIVVSILNDAAIEGNETVLLILSNPSNGVAIGSQGSATLTITDDDALPSFYNLTMLLSPGGSASPESGQYPTNSVQVLTATPVRDYEFVRWEGTLTSTDNPLPLVMARDHAVTARFRTRKVLDSFESGNLLTLPWLSVNDHTGWVVQNGIGSDAHHAARSGLLTDGQGSSLFLVLNTRVGVGSFDFRVSSEQGWDYLEFYLNGTRLERWSGESGWQSYQFVVTAGASSFEWRYVKDANFSEGLDTAFIDNLYLPQDTPDTTDPSAALTLYQFPAKWPLLKVQGQGGRSYVLEVSENLISWTPFSTNYLDGPLMFIEHSQGTNRPAAFYRVLIP